MCPKRSRSLISATVVSTACSKAGAFPTRATTFSIQAAGNPRQHFPWWWTRCAIDHDMATSQARDKRRMLYREGRFWHELTVRLEIVFFRFLGLTGLSAAAARTGSCDPKRSSPPRACASLASAAPKQKRILDCGCASSLDDRNSHHLGSRQFYKTILELNLWRPVELALEAGGISCDVPDVAEPVLPGHDRLGAVQGPAQARAPCRRRCEACPSRR